MKTYGACRTVVLFRCHAVCNERSVIQMPTNNLYVNSEAFTAVMFQVEVSWVVTPFSVLCAMCYIFTAK
jgi:hypothetical protein